MAGTPDRSPYSHRPLQLFVSDGFRCFAERGWQGHAGGFGQRPDQGVVMDGMAGDKVQLACERRRAEMELAAGETDRKADRYGFIGLMIAERMQACGNPVEASCCDHRRLLDRAIPCAMIIVNQLAGTAVQERFIV